MKTFNFGYVAENICWLLGETWAATKKGESPIRAYERAYKELVVEIEDFLNKRVK